MNNRLPNLLILGAQKAATTALYDWLSQHPEIYGNEAMKEFPFLVFDEQLNKGEQWFRSNFVVPNSKKIVLHGYVNYMYFYHKFVEKYKKSSLKGKFIIVLRNPVNRAYSAYWYNKSKGIEKHKTFKDALIFNQNHFKKWGFKEDCDFSYLEHGLYFEQLNYLFSNLESKKIKIIIYEELMSHKNKVMDEICDFLEINSFEFNFTQVNTAKELKYPFIKNLIYGLKAKVPPFLRNSLPERAKHNFRRQIREVTAVDFAYPKILPEDEEFLYEFYEETNSELENLLNKKLPWKLEK